MTSLPLLIVTVLSSGGPPHAGPSPLTDATVRVRQAGSLLAVSNVGNVELRLRPGTYEVDAALLPPVVGREQRCESRQVRLPARRGARVSVTLSCSIK